MSDNTVTDAADIKAEAVKRVVFVENLEIKVLRDRPSQKGNIPVEIWLTGTPKSYKIAADAPYGGKELFTWGVTWVTPDDATNIEQNGWHGIPAQRIQMSIRDGGLPNSEFDILRRACAKHRGLLTFGADGKPTSTMIGHMVEFELGYHAIRGQEYQPYKAVPARIADDYIAPPESEMYTADRPVGVRKETSGGGFTAAPTVATPSGPSTEALQAAVITAGLAGQTLNVLNDKDFAASAIMRNRLKAPVLVHPEVQKAADDGALGTYLVAKGAAQDVNGVLEAV